ncbi:hypothetical protein ACYRDJ_003094 [Yersinia enterocolitica]|uniref:hypothetical protein n=1 Tax=Yersinia enterocolitica TaxID=630 RepID=UPI0030C9DC0E
MSENTDYETLAADYIELDKKYREVTAENMLLKVAARDMLSGWKEIRRSGGESEIYGIGWDRSQSAVESALNTPATTQALNEIKARGVDEFTAKIARDLRMAGGGHGYHEEPYHEFADHIECKGGDFAASLRSNS